MPARILIIEDNFASLQLMEYMLRAFSYRVSSAVNGKAGLEAVLNEFPDLIICDLQMPAMDGFEFLRNLRQMPGHSATPVVAVTALAMVGDRDLALAAGFDGYLSKPIDLERFVPQIERFLPPERPTVLVVEQATEKHAMASAVWQLGRYRVLVANSAHQAILLARNPGCQLMLSAAQLDGGSGNELLAALRADSQLKELPFLLATSALTGELWQCFGPAQGDARLLPSPIKPAELLNEIDFCLRGEGIR